MKLHVGQRLQTAGAGGQPGGYVVTEVVAETPWYGLYGGKKIFANFDFAAKRVRETDDKEWLDVLLRTVRYPIHNDPAYVARRRELARAEIRRLGVRGSNLWPEPLDLLDLENTQDRFAFDDPDTGREPVLVFARPQGKLLAEWRTGATPLTSILSVLAELLAFMGQAHAEGLLLNGLGSATLLIDRADRIHYLGGDLALETAAAKKLDAAAWQRLFPSERYPRGFAPPECFQGIADVRSDLYAWAALAFSLLTGVRPWQIALEQGQPWAHFQEPHFVQLAKALRQVPSPLVDSFAEQLGVASSALRAGWPAPLVGLFRRLLHHDPRRRPAAVADLVKFLEQPPPPPEGAFVAFFYQEGQARLFLDLAPTAAELDLIVQRGIGAVPRHPGEGTCRYAGEYRPAIDDPETPLPPEPIYYSAFFRRRGQASVDPALTVSTELREASPAGLRRWAEDLAGPAAPDVPPVPLATTFKALGQVTVAEALLASPAARVRAWAAACLAPALASADRQRAEQLLQKCLHDPLSAPRHQAGRILLEAADPADDAFALGLLRTVGQGDLDETLEVVQTWRKEGVRPEQLARLQRVLEGERPATCPACHEKLPYRDRTGHLRDVHGWLEVAGHLLPREQALPRLWNRIFEQSDVNAHERLLGLFSGDWKSYTAALEEDLGRRPELAAAAKQTSISATIKVTLQPYWNTLRQTSAAADAGRHLLASAHPLARVIGQETVLPLLAERLRNGLATASNLRRELESLCPGPDLLDERLLLCSRLAQAGADPDVVEPCLAELKLDQNVRCDVCGDKIRLGDLETHLRRSHDIFQFRGLRQDYQATRASILDALCGTHPDPAAFRALEELTQDRYPDRPERHLATWVCHKLRGLGKERRKPVFHAVGQTLAEAPSLPRLLPVLAGAMKNTELAPAARMLALTTAARLSAPPSPPVLACLKPLLANKTLPRQTREDAVAGLLAAAGKEGPAAAEILDTFVAGLGKLRAIARLQELEKRLGQSTALNTLVASLEDQVRMDCPRCGVQLQRTDMVHHLWDRHRLVLEGRRVREPWHQIADWVVDYRLEKDAAVLQRSRELAAKVDPDKGLDRLARLLLRHGVADRDALQALLDKARQQHAGLCPYCFAEVPIAPDPPVATLVAQDHALEGFGFRLTLSDRRLIPRLEIETPTEIVHRGREPGRLCTRLGSLVFVVAPVVLALFGALFLLTAAILPLGVIVAFSAGLALVLGGMVYLFWPSPGPMLDRLTDAAWRDLVPLLGETSWSPAELQFIAGLAQLSGQAGDPAVRADALDLLRGAFADEARGKDGFWPPLAMLSLLALHDAGVTGDRDPLVLLADEIARALGGKAPLRYAGQLLEDWYAAGPKDAPRRRLTALVQARAFSLGLEVQDMIELGRAHRALPAAFGLDDIDGLAQRRLLWTLRGLAPWQRWARGETAFELAEAAVDRAFDPHPGLLVFAQDGDIALTSQGPRLDTLCIDDGPHRIDVVRVKDGYEIQAGPHRAFFYDNPNRLADELERWQAFYFKEFLAQLAGQTNRPASELGKTLRKTNSQPCPGCGRWLLARAGEVGLAAETDRDSSPSAH